jgi:hypothetical protein
MSLYPNTKYISYCALSNDVFTEKLTLLQEFLKSHATVYCGGLESPDRCVGPLYSVKI